MKQYLDIVRDVIDNGLWKENRTGIKTLALPGVFFEHNVEDGFPLLTVRRMPIKSIAVEVEGFLKGITSKKWYQERGCKFWDNWSNPKVAKEEYDIAQGQAASDEVMGLLSYEPTIQEIQKKVDDLGPLGYSYQLRRFNQVYDEDDNGCVQRYDQLKNIVDTLKQDPNDRRMVAGLWNPIQLNRMALPPCTVAWVVNVIDGKLNLSWLQRSCDAILGLPSDIANMGMIQTLLAVEAGLYVGKLSGLLVDCHIYENHIDNAMILLERAPRALPTLGIIDGDDSRPGYKFNIFEWTHNDFTLYNYNPHDKLDMGTIAV